LSDLAVAVLTKVAHEAGIVDIGLCLVVPPDHVAPFVRSLDSADVRELFDIHPTIASAADTAS
jgi:hypothetical protein